MRKLLKDFGLQLKSTSCWQPPPPRRWPSRTFPAWGSERWRATCRCRPCSFLWCWFPGAPWWSSARVRRFSASSPGTSSVRRRSAGSGTGLEWRRGMVLFWMAKASLLMIVSFKLRSKTHQKIKLTRMISSSLGEKQNFRLQEKNFQFPSTNFLIDFFHLSLIDGFRLPVDGILSRLLVLAVNEQRSPQVAGETEREQVENLLLRDLGWSSYDRP